MTANEIRDSFKKFFESKQHAIVPSAPMVIKDDPTLMFTNAGMNQWKDIILGTREPEPRRRADTQKCLRVSGKHNDLEEVGHDTYHHTMFEMLGNWSFGDYFKEGAIDMAWEYLVDVLKLNPEDLYVTVFEGSPEENIPRDDEAAKYWAKHVPEDHIINGNKHDNFWEMGDTGPCGPCSEIHVDSRTPEQRKASGKTGRELVNQDDPQVIEIWNIVFMQFNRKADGSLEKLGMNVIDTGMGFERLVRMMQGKHSNYDTDVFQPIIKAEQQITGLKYTTFEEETENPISKEQDDINVAMRVCADHLRAVAFSIADGQLPSNAKAGYVIRRILRRAVRYAYTFLGQKEAFLYKLLPTLVERAQEGFFLLLHHAGNERLLSLQFGEGVAHLLDERGQQLVEESLFLSEERVGIAHGAAQDAADNIAGLGIRWQLTVGDREGNGTQVVGADAHGHVDVVLTLCYRLRAVGFVFEGSIFQSRYLLFGLDDGLEHVGVVVRVLALHHAHQALEAHARVDNVHRQLLQRAVGLAVELHEHEVPYLDHLRVVLVHQVATADAAGLALLGSARVDVNLRAGTAGACVAHLPEIVVLVAVDDVVFGHMLGPVFRGLVIAGDVLFG